MSACVWYLAVLLTKLLLFLLWLLLHSGLKDIVVSVNSKHLNTTQAVYLHSVSNRVGGADLAYCVQAFAIQTSLPV